MAENTKANDVKENVETVEEKTTTETTDTVETTEVPEVEEKEVKGKETKEVKNPSTKAVKKEEGKFKTFIVEKNVPKKDKDGNVVINKKGEVEMERITIERKMKI